MIAPKLRFKKPDGTDYDKWETRVLSEIFTEISEKGHPEMPVLSILQGFGTVLRDDSNRKIEYSKDNLKNYKVMRKDDFIIHLRTFEGGLECANQDGISSPAYKILRSNGINVDLYKAYFRSYNFIEGVLAEAVVGIRDGKNIDMDIFWDIEIPYPSEEEQSQMAKCFRSYDDLIIQQMETISALQSRRNAIMQQVFSQELRFISEDGSEFPDWDTEELNYYLYENKERNKKNKYGKEDVLSVSKDYGVVNQIQYQGKSLAGDDVSNYHVVYKGDVVYTKSPLGKQPYGIIKASNMEGIVSTLYAVYHCKETIIPELLDYYFSLDGILNRYLKPLVNIGAKHDMKVNNEDALTGLVSLPSSLEEQQKIIDFFKLIDEQIQIEKDKLEAIKNVKKGLLQQMFV